MRNKLSYLKNYSITEEQINELIDIYNKNIIAFISENEIFIKEKLEYLKEKEYNIYLILKNNIKIFLEILPELKRKMTIMENNNFSKQQIQMILINERLYSKIK